MFQYEFPKLYFSDISSAQEDIRVFYSIKNLSEFLDRYFYKDINNLLSLVSENLFIDFERSLSGESFYFNKIPSLKNKSVKQITDDLKLSLNASKKTLEYILSFADSRIYYTKEARQLDETAGWTNNQFLYWDGSEISSTSIPTIDSSLFSMNRMDLSSFPESNKFVGGLNDEIVYFDEGDITFIPKGKIQIQLTEEGNNFVFHTPEVIDLEGEVFISNRKAGGTNTIMFHGRTINFSSDPLLIGDTFQTARFLYNRTLNTFLLVGTNV